MESRRQISQSKEKNGVDHFLPLELLWKSDIDIEQKIGSYVGTPLYFQGILIFDVIVEKAFYPKKLIAVEARTGKEIWNHQFEIPQYISTPSEYCLFQNSVLVSDDISDLLFIEEGKVIQRFKNLGVWSGIPVIHKDILILCKVNGLFFIRLPDMILLNTFEVDRPHSIACIDEKVIFGSREKEANLYCLNIKSGELEWKHPIHKTGEYRQIPLTRKEREKGGKIVSGKFRSGFPIIGGSKIFCSLGKFFSSFDLENGQLLWKAENPFLKDAIYQNGRIYGFDGFKLNCLNADTGDTIYEKKIDMPHSIQSKPFLAGNILFAGNERGLFAFNIESGDIAWKYDEEGGFTVQPCLIDGKLYAGKTGIPGSMYCFGYKQKG